MAGTKLRYKVVIVAPTCFYYQVTLFRKLAAHPRIDLLVCFCSDESLYARDVHEMYKTDSSWGDEGQLLDGFKYRFLKNRSLSPSYLKWPFGLINPLKDYVAEHNLESVHFFGFQGRSEIAKFYAVSDVLVLPSRRETWGIVVNEALCFRLPVIVSDQVGAGRDQVRDGHNGYRFPAGDVEMLAERIDQLMDLPEDKRTLMGIISLKMITGWAERDLPGSLDAYLDYVYSKK